MSRNISTNYREQVNPTAGVEPVYLLEITHPQLSQPIRVVNDNQDLVSQGNTYTAFAFRISLPDDISKQMPSVPLMIDNIGREMTQWLEASSGGKGAQVTIKQVMRNAPDVIEMSYTFTLLHVAQNMLTITGQLGYENLLNQPCLTATYTPDTAPAIF